MHVTWDGARDALKVVSCTQRVLNICDDDGGGGNEKSKETHSFIS